MAVRIPTYEDRLTPSGFGVTPQARGVEVSGAIGQGMQNLGNAGMTLAGTEMAVLRQKHDADAVANLYDPLAKGDLYWSDWLTNAKKNAKDGGNLAGDNDTVVPIREKAQQDFDTWSTQFLAGVTNEKAKRAATQHISSLRTTVLNRAMAVQAEADVNNRSDKVDQAVTTWASLSGKDDTAALTSIQAAKTMIANSGFDQHTATTKALAAQKTIAESAITGALMRNPQLTREALLQRWGMTEADLNRTAPAAPGQVPGSSTTASSIDSFWPLVIRQESGGKQTNKDGTPLTSPKGAIGIAQVMPGTGPEAARLAGIPWDDKRYRTDAAYNEQLGKAYMAQQLTTFGGDVRKALAAYNMGPGKAEKGTGVAGLVAKYGDDWLSHAPKETQNYVATITGQMGGGGRTSASVPMATAPKVQVPQDMMTLVGMLDQDRVGAFVNAANTEISRIGTMYRSQLATTENDHVAAYMNGQPPQRPLTEAEYTKAYGPVEGPQRFANYQSIATVGSDINALKLSTPAEITQIVERNKPDPAKPGYDLANKRYAAVVAAAERIVQERNADPVAYAMANRVGNAKPINWNNQDEAGAELRNRLGVADTMTRSFGAPYAILSKEEASKLSTGLNNMSAPQKLAYFGTIAKAIPNPDALTAVMNQIAPDSPVSAVAGRLVLMDQPNVAAKGTWWRNERAYSPQVVASMIMRGEELLNPSKAAKSQDGKVPTHLMPKEQDFQLQFYNQVGTSFTGQQRDAYSIAYQSVKAYYAAKMEQMSDYSGNLNQNALNEAVEAVTGGATDINGRGKVRRPWGMMEDTFTNTAKSAFDAKMLELGRTGPQYNFRLYGLENYGDGYRVREGTGYMLDKDGRQVVIDVTGNMAQPVRPTDVSKPVGALGKPITQTPNTK